MEKQSEKQTSRDEWWEKIKAVSEASAKPREVEKEKGGKEKEEKRKFSNLFIFCFLAIIVLGIIPRLHFIFYVSNPENAGVDWYGDTYHHWQIAYLTYTTGLSHGFLRLWDLKGMEFFWGVFHPLLMSLVFWITGSTSIILARLISVFFGLGDIILISLLVGRFWGKRVALSIAFFGAFFSIAIFNDTTGMVDGIGTFFILLGLYFWPKRPILMGVSFVLASMVRAEAWLFTFGLMIAMFLIKERADKKGFAFGAYAVGMLLYMKYLLNYTSNPIYPVYWNFLSNAVGVWSTQKPLNALQLTVKPILMISAGISFCILLFILYKRPKSLLYLLFGFGNIFFVTALMGFGTYIVGWEWWFPYIRFFVFPYLFIAGLIFVLIDKLRVLPNLLKSIFLGIIVVSITLLSQLAWPQIMKRFDVTVKHWVFKDNWGKEVAQYYKGGTILFPETDQGMTYEVVQDAHVDGKNILSQMFDPFYYIGEDEVFNNWGRYKKDIDAWTKKNDIRLAIIQPGRSRYYRLQQKEPEVFIKEGMLYGNLYEVWAVHPENIKE